MSNGTQAGKKSSSSFHFVAGLGSGIFSAVLLQPADLLKTRVQQSHSTTLLATIREISSSPNSILSFWRGTLPSALRTGFGSAIYFTSLNALRSHVARSNLLRSIGAVKAGAGTGAGTGGAAAAAAGSTRTSPTSAQTQAHQQAHSSSLPKLSNLANLTTGAVARTGAGLILMPMTIIKVRYESSLYSYRSILGAGRDILRTEGVRGFFSGFGATAIRDAPYAGLYVLFYEQLKKRLSALSRSPSGSADDKDKTKDKDKDKDNDSAAPASSPPAAPAGTMKSSTSVSINFSSGVLAAGLATAFTNPFDAIKTRIQLRPREYLNLLHAGRKMVREDGVKSLFDGLGLRMGRKALSSALAWTVYEELIRRAETAFKKTPQQESVL